MHAFIRCPRERCGRQLRRSRSYTYCTLCVDPVPMMAIIGKISVLLLLTGTGFGADPDMGCSRSGTIFADPKNCADFYMCDSNHQAIHMHCPSGTYFSIVSDVCDHMQNVDCMGRPEPGKIRVIRTLCFTPRSNLIKAMTLEPRRRLQPLLLRPPSRQLLLLRRRHPLPPRQGLPQLPRRRLQQRLRRRRRNRPPQGRHRQRPPRLRQ